MVAYATKENGALSLGFSEPSLQVFPSYLPSPTPCLISAPNYCRPSLETQRPTLAREFGRLTSDPHLPLDFYKFKPPVSFQALQTTWPNLPSIPGPISSGFHRYSPPKWSLPLLDLSPPAIAGVLNSRQSQKPQATFVREISSPNNISSSFPHLFQIHSVLLPSFAADHLPRPLFSPPPSRVNYRDPNLQSSVLIPLHYPTTQYQQEVTGSLWATLNRKASRLTKDRHLFLHSSKSNPTVPFPMLKQTFCSLSVPIQMDQLSRTWWKTMVSFFLWNSFITLSLFLRSQHLCTHWFCVSNWPKLQSSDRKEFLIRTYLCGIHL